MAAMESELFLLKRSFERLDQQYRRAEEKIGDFREKLKEARGELSTKDRQLEATRRLLAKLGQEKSELAAVAEESRDLSRKLGAKLSLSGGEVPELTAKLQRSKRKVTELTAQLHEAQTRLLLAEEATRQQSAEVVVLKKALGLRSELPDFSGYGYDGQAQLLQSLAKSQEESAALVGQLADSGRRVNALEQQVVHLHGELERLVGARVAAEEALLGARREAADAHGRAAATQIDLDELQSQMRRTNAHLEEVLAARRAADDRCDELASKIRALKDKTAAADRSNKAQIESLRSEIRSVVEASEAAAEQGRAVHAAREAALEAQVAGLQKQVLEQEARAAQSARDHEVDLLRLQSRAGALEASLEGSKLREGSLERDAAALREEVERLARNNQDLSMGLAAARAEAAANAERAEDAAASTDSERRLRMQAAAQMEAATNRGAVREEQLGLDAARLRAEGATMALANERLTAEIKECQEQLSSSAARQAANERHIEELHATIQSLTKSKTKLQSTMLEQLSLFKSKLQQVEHENLALRTALAGSSSSAATAAAAAAASSPSPSLAALAAASRSPAAVASGYRGSPAHGDSIAAAAAAAVVASERYGGAGAATATSGLYGGGGAGPGSSSYSQHHHLLRGSAAAGGVQTSYRVGVSPRVYDSDDE
ncbi:hypothetical protein CHLRE_01g005813v5 [Chlamydomonas reinhardtii]|uniref:Uncharacterized protein n=1 Tax=Chlamydomonas reinhardtii TaxID=3055 RepID=A0A2K3E526_CHLRE|nr:uncharacterized protein CHLRE_01g005813v5 [Chlamydomonas reinhardtii]PNW87884.1 hypothetical protein CHLRE_01g005813v5 [Chlamydomonas reinhardtii]